MLGTDRIGRYEHVVVEWVKGVVPEGVREGWREWMGQMPVEIEGDGGEGGKIVLGGEEGKKKVEGYAVVTGGDDGEVPGVGVGVAGYDHGVKEAEQRNKSENASEFFLSLSFWSLLLVRLDWK